MRQHSMLTAMLAAGAIGCSDNPSAPTLTDQSNSVADAATRLLSTRRDRPMAGSCRGSFTLTPIDYLPPPQQDLPAHQSFVGSAQCRFTHLGRTRATSEGLVDFTGDPFRSAGTAIYTAADGDQLWATESGEISFPDDAGRFTTTGHSFFTGGTGRFAGASGAMECSGQGDLASATTSCHGTIRF